MSFWEFKDSRNFPKSFALYFWFKVWVLSLLLPLPCVLSALMWTPSFWNCKPQPVPEVALISIFHHSSRKVTNTWSFVLLFVFCHKGNIRWLTSTWGKSQLNSNQHIKHPTLWKPLFWVVLLYKYNYCCPKFVLLHFIKFLSMNWFLFHQKKKKTCGSPKFCMCTSKLKSGP